MFEDQPPDQVGIECSLPDDQNAGERLPTRCSCAAVVLALHRICGILSIREAVLAANLIRRSIFEHRAQICEDGLCVNVWSRGLQQQPASPGARTRETLGLREAPGEVRDGWVGTVRHALTRKLTLTSRQPRDDSKSQQDHQQWRHSRVGGRRKPSPP